jgi:hypothetical protein
MVLEAGKCKIKVLTESVSGEGLNPGSVSSPIIMFSHNRDGKQVLSGLLGGH